MLHSPRWRRARRPAGGVLALVTPPLDSSVGCMRVPRQLLVTASVPWRTGRFRRDAPRTFRKISGVSTLDDATAATTRRWVNVTVCRQVALGIVVRYLGRSTTRQSQRRSTFTPGGVITATVATIEIQQSEQSHPLHRAPGPRPLRRGRHLIDAAGLPTGARQVPNPAQT